MLAVVVAARHAGPRHLDRLSLVVSMAGLSTAPYVLALVLAVHLHAFPVIGFVPLSGSVPSHIKSLTLPALPIGFALFSVCTRPPYTPGVNGAPATFRGGSTSLPPPVWTPYFHFYDITTSATSACSAATCCRTRAEVPSAAAGAGRFRQLAAPRAQPL
jgi:hypothetical protein